MQHDGLTAEYQKPQQQGQMGKIHSRNDKIYVRKKMLDKEGLKEIKSMVEYLWICRK